MFVKEAPPLYRTFFLIRHGESKWNEAQEKIHIAGMLNRDHPLTEDGINQALSLNARWKLAGIRNTKLSESSGPGVIDCGRLNEDDLRAIEGDDDGDDSDGEGPARKGTGTSKSGNKGMSKLYDSIFQRHSSVTAAGKNRPEAMKGKTIIPKFYFFSCN